MRRTLFVICCGFILQHLSAQENPGYIDLVRAEKQLAGMFDALYNEEILGTNLSLFLQIDTLFHTALKHPGSFDYQWKELDKIGKLSSDDGVMKVYSWLYMYNRNDYHYRAYIQVRTGRDEVEVFRLEPATGDARFLEEFDQSLDQWHGKIYYDIVTKTYRRKTFYTLVGADFKDANSSLKTIEVVVIQRGKPIFRDDQFLDGGTVKDRVVLEFSADVAASVRYNKDLDLIVFDHLSPLHPIYTGNFQFYGPDGSYDGYKFMEGIWILEQDVDARNN